MSSITTLQQPALPFQPPMRRKNKQETPVQKQQEARQASVIPPRSRAKRSVPTDYKAEYRRTIREERELKEKAYAPSDEQKQQDAKLAERQKAAKTKGEWQELERQRRLLVGKPTPQQQKRLDELRARRLDLERRMAPPAPKVETPAVPKAQPNFSQVAKETTDYNAAWDWDNDASVTNGTDNVVKAIMKANHFDQYTEAQQHAILDAINRGGGALIEYDLPVSDAFFGAAQHSVKGVLDLSFPPNNGSMTPKERIEHAVHAQLEKEQQRVLKTEGHRQFMHTHYTVSNPKIELKETPEKNTPIDQAIASIPNFQSKLNQEINVLKGKGLKDIHQAPTLMAAAREAVKTYGYGLNSPEDYQRLSDPEKAQKILDAASAILEKDQQRTLGQLNSAQQLNNAETVNALRSDTYLAKQYAKLLGIPPENALKLLTEPVADKMTLAGYNSQVDKDTYKWAWLGGGLLGEGIAAIRVALSEHHHDKTLEKPNLMQLLADPGNRLRLSQHWQAFKKADANAHIPMPKDNPFPQLLEAVGKLGGGTRYQDNHLHDNSREDVIHAFDQLFSRTDINDNDNLPEQIKHNRDTHRQEGEAQIAEAVKSFRRLEALKIIANSNDNTRFQSASQQKYPEKQLTVSESQQLEQSVKEYQQQLTNRLNAENDDLHNYMTNEEEWDAEVKELATNIMPLFSGFVTGYVDAKEGKGWQAAAEFGQALFEVAALAGGPITEGLEEAEVISSQTAQVMRYVASGINKAYGAYGTLQLGKEAVQWLQAEATGDRKKANALLSSLLLSARNLAVFSAASGAIEKARTRLGSVESEGGQAKTPEQQQFVEDIIGNREGRFSDSFDSGHEPPRTLASLLPEGWSINDNPNYHQDIAGLKSKVANGIENGFYDGQGNRNPESNTGYFVENNQIHLAKRRANGDIEIVDGNAPPHQRGTQFVLGKDADNEWVEIDREAIRDNVENQGSGDGEDSENEGNSPGVLPSPLSMLNEGYQRIGDLSSNPRERFDDLSVSLRDINGEFIDPEVTPREQIDGDTIRRFQYHDEYTEFVLQEINRIKNGDYPDTPSELTDEDYNKIVDSIIENTRLGDSGLTEKEIAAYRETLQRFGENPLFRGLVQFNMRYAGMRRVERGAERPDTVTINGDRYDGSLQKNNNPQGIPEVSDISDLRISLQSPIGQDPAYSVFNHEINLPHVPDEGDPNLRSFHDSVFLHELVHALTGAQDPSEMTYQKNGKNYHPRYESLGPTERLTRSVLHGLRMHENDFTSRQSYAFPLGKNSEEAKHLIQKNGEEWYESHEEADDEFNDTHDDYERTYRTIRSDVSNIVDSLENISLETEEERVKLRKAIDRQLEALKRENAKIHKNDPLISQENLIAVGFAENISFPQLKIEQVDRLVDYGLEDDGDIDDFDYLQLDRLEQDNEEYQNIARDRQEAALRGFRKWLSELDSDEPIHNNRKRPHEDSESDFEEETPRKKL